jgi:hypothetical protein
MDTPDKGLPFISETNKTSRHTPFHTLSIEAEAGFCYRLLAAFERYPEWVSRAMKVKVLDRYPDGRGKIVSFEYDFFLRKFHYILEYSYDDTLYTLSWTRAGGDPELIEITGSYHFQPLGPNKTMASYELALTLGFVPSQRLLNFGSTILMRKEMKNFKLFVEKQFPPATAASS